MKKFLTVLLGAVLAMCSVGCSQAEPIPEAVHEETAPETVAETEIETEALTEPETVIQPEPVPETERTIIAQVYANPPEGTEYSNLYVFQPDAGSVPIARLYRNDVLQVYDMMNDWYHVQFGELEGYVPAEEISIAPIEEEPAPETQAPEPIAEEVPEPETVIEYVEVYVEPEPEPEPAPPEVSITGHIVFIRPLIDYGYGLTEADGTECFFEVDGGNFAYYEMQYSVVSDDDEMTNNTVNTSDSVYRLAAGSSPVPQSARATVTPYDSDGNPGTPFSCSGSISDLVVREFTPAEREKG